MASFEALPLSEFSYPLAIIPTEASCNGFESNSRESVMSNSRPHLSRLLLRSCFFKFVE